MALIVIAGIVMADIVMAYRCRPLIYDDPLGLRPQLKWPDPAAYEAAHCAHASACACARAHVHACVHACVHTCHELTPPHEPRPARHPDLRAAHMHAQPNRANGVYSYGLYSYGLYSYGLYSYGSYSYGSRVAQTVYYLRPKTHVAGAPMILNFSKNRQNDVESFSLRSGLSDDMRFA